MFLRIVVLMKILGGNMSKKIKITSSKIPSSFKGYKILQISDLHNKKFGDNQDVLIQKMKSIDQILLQLRVI
jgi:predicted MPP superfamily phosphohydrolase